MAIVPLMITLNLVQNLAISLISIHGQKWLHVGVNYYLSIACHKHVNNYKTKIFHLSQNFSPLIIRL